MPGFWFREDMHLPRPVSPLAATVILPAIARAFGEGVTRMGGPGHLVDVRVVDGYAYNGFSDAPPPPGPPTEAEMEAMMAAHRALPRRWEADLLPAVHGLHAELRAVAPGPVSADRARKDLDHVLEIVQRNWHLHFEVMPALTGAIAMEQLLAQAGVPRGAHEGRALVDGLPNAIADLDRELAGLGARIEADAKLAGLVEEGDADALVAALTASPGPTGEAFRTLWPKLRERPTSFELFEPTWGEDPTPLLRAVRGGGPSAKHLEATAATLAAGRASAEARVRTSLPGPMHSAFAGLLAAHRAAWPLMQTHHYWMDELTMGLARLALLRCAEPLVGARGLAGREEVVWLQLDELRAALDGQRLSPGLVERRRREREAALRLVPAPTIGTPPPSVLQDPMFAMFYGLRVPEPAQEGVLRGHAASPGRVRGRARVVAHEGELDALQPGEVLVAASTDPSWTLLMGRAAAMVTDTGGVLCHAAIVARERCVPAVTGAQGATRKLRSGDTVEVDGDAGTVTILHRA